METYLTSPELTKRLRLMGYKPVLPEGFLLQELMEVMPKQIKEYDFLTLEHANVEIVETAMDKIVRPSGWEVHYDNPRAECGGEMLGGKYFKDDDPLLALSALAEYLLDNDLFPLSSE